MLSPTSKNGLAAVVSLGLLVPGCPEPTDDGGNKNARPAIVFRFLSGSNVLESDGSSTLRVGLTARDATGEPDDATVTITADAGLVGIAGAAPSSPTLSATPQNGELAFDYQCEPWSEQPVSIAVSNASASATVVISCVDPSGVPKIQIIGPATGEIVNGAPVTLDISVLDVSGRPAAGEEVTVIVEGGAGDAVVSAGGTTGVAVTTALDDNGRLAATLDTPIDAEDTSYTVRVSYLAAPTRPVTEQSIVLTNTLDNRSAIRMAIEGSNTSGSGTVRGGAPASVLLEVLDVQGLPAAGASVVLSVDGPGTAVLSSGGDEGESIEVTLDEAGAATFIVDPPASIEEEAVYVITASYEFIPGEQPADETFELTNLFQDDSEITVTGLTSIEGGTTAPLSIRVINAAGVPAAGESVGIAIAGGNGGATVTQGASTGATITATLNSVGETTVEVNAPASPAPTTYTLTVNYDLFPGLLTTQKIVPITVTEQGGLTLNLEADAEQIRSDVPAERATTVRITLRRGTSVPPGASVTLRIPDIDATRVKFSPRAGQTATRVTLSSAAGDISATGEASVSIEALPNVPSAEVTILATGTDTDATTSDISSELAVAVFRAPILQSMVASDPAPSTISVRGGVDRSTSVIRFTLFDDADKPMPGVPVTFRTNATADRQISVSTFAISDEGGTVETVLSAGTISGPVSVIATASPVSPDPSVTAPTLTVQSPPIAITGGLPNFLMSFMSCAQAVELKEGSTLSCELTLVDRFTNLVDGQLVQFKAEGGGTVATSNTGGGKTSATVTLDDGDTLSGASLPNWSHGVLPAPGTTITGFDGCTDGTVTTPCNILGICSSTSTAVNQYCPLAPSCVDEAVTARNRLLGSATGTNVVLTFPATGVGTNTSANLQSYIDLHRICGFPVSCFTGTLAHREGVAEIPGDECPVAAGCFDFDSRTPCPHDGLLTVVATTRGEESFVDENGNGRYDEGEEFIDLPEPFLDKNESCSFDEFSGDARFQFSTAERIRHTDLFADVNGDGVYGFGTDATTGRLLEGNEVYDSDAETFFSGKALVVGGGLRTRVIAGRSCTAGTAGCIENAYGARGFLENPRPKEGGARGTGIDPDGLDTSLSGSISGLTEPGAVEVFFRVEDHNGNCPSPNFSTAINVEVVSGPVKLSPVDLKLDAQNCGMVPESNLLRPHCEEALSLGAPTGSVNVTADCAAAEAPGNSTAEVKISAGGDRPATLTFNVTCNP